MHILQILLMNQIIRVIIGMALLALRVQILVQMIAVLLAALAVGSDKGPASCTGCEPCPWP